MSQQIKIFDTTLRDGEQSPGFSMNTREKVLVAKQLDRLRVDIIEAGFPISSPDDFEAVRTISEVVEHAEVCGLARAMEKDVITAWEAVKGAKKPRIHTFCSTSEIQLKHQLRKTEEEALEMSINAVKLAKSLCDRVDFSPMDATRTRSEYLYQIIHETIKAGADTINIPDSVGYATPEEFAKFIQDIIDHVPEIKNCTLSVHCHNDLGLATANSLAAVLVGATEIQGTVNGIGERAGNTSLEEVVMAIKTRGDFYDHKTGIETREIYPTSKLITTITGIPVQPNKAIVGANAFAHEAGIHQDGILKNRETWEIMNPQDIGLDKNKLVLGKHSGRHALKDRLQQLGYNLTDDELNTVFVKFKDLADKKKQIFDEDLGILMSETGEWEAQFALRDLQVVCGTLSEPSAQVVLVNKQGQEFTVEHVGDGPVDAAYGAVNQIVQLSNNLLEYSVNAVTEGIDAQAVVSVRIQVDDKLYTGNDGNTDIVVASVKAYLEALNKALNNVSKTKPESIPNP